MKAISINSKTHGTMNVLVDDEDYDNLVRYNWFIYCCILKGKRARTYYAVCHIKGHTVRMHRMIMGIADSKILIDHKDHNGLNNQKINLRMATPQQNQFNMRMMSHNKTGFKGVSYHKGDKKYMVFLRFDGKNRYFGSFDTPKDAAIKWNELARQYHGEFAYQNPV